MIKRLKKAAALLSAAILAGSMGIPVSAQEINEDIPEAAVSSGIETNITVSGITTTLDCEKAAASMEQNASGEAASASDWFLRMNLTGYAANLYYILENGTNGDGLQDFDDSAFLESNLLTLNYSDGTADTFSGIKLVDIPGDSQMTEEEWALIRENLCNAYSAFILDHPTVSWLSKAPMITRAAYSWTSENGSVSWQYKIYLQLKNDICRYDIRCAVDPDPNPDTPGSDPAAPGKTNTKSDAGAASGGDPSDDKNQAVSINTAGATYTALKNAVTTVSDDSSADPANDNLSGLSTAYLYLPTSSGSYNMNWFLSDIFESVANKAYYGDTWGEYVDLADIGDSISLTIDGDPDSTHHDAADGQFILKNYMDMQILTPDTLLKPGNLNPHCLFWEYNGTEYLVARTDPHMHLQVNPKPLTVEAGSLQITQAADGSKNPSGEPDFDGLIAGESLTQQDWEIIPTDNINSAEKIIQVRVALTNTNDANLKYTLANDLIWVPYEANLTVDPSDVKITLTDRGPFIYNGQEHRPNVEVIIYDHILDKNNYEVSYSKNIDAGTATVSVISKTDTDYHWSGMATTTFIINKAVWPEKYGEGFTRYGRQGVFNLYDLNLLAPDGSVDLDHIVFTDSRIYASGAEPSVSNGILQYEIEDSAALVGHSSTILIPVDSSNNYESYTITFIVTVSDKTMQDFKFLHEAQKKPLGSTDTLELTSPAEGSKVTYRSSNDDIVTINQNGRINALREGTVIIYATASAIDEYAEATTQCILTIVPEDHEVTMVELTDRDKQYKLEIEEGISQVSDPLRSNTELNLNTPSKIDARLREEVKKANDQIEDANIAVYDITLLTKKNNNWVWEEVPDEDFPSDGLLAKIPYPKDTDGATHDYTVVHMFDSTYGNKLGQIEHPATDESGDMLRFTVHALSPVAVGWTEQADVPDDPTDPTNPTDPANPTNPTNPGTTPGGTTPTPSGGSGTVTGRSSSGGSASGSSGGSGGGGGVFYRVATGDTSPIIVYGSLFAASVVLITIICLIRKELKK